jgi:hypothetical protein
MVAKRKSTLKLSTGVAKRSSFAKASLASAKVGFKKSATLKKIRIGILVGKDFDPVKKDSHPPNFPKKLILTNEDWGKYSIDAVTQSKYKDYIPTS